MFLSCMVGVLLLSHYSSTKPVEVYSALTDSLSSDVVLNNLPSLQLQIFGDHLYYFGAIYEGNYFRAMQFCNYHGMQLVSIESKEENDFLWKYLQTFLGRRGYWFWASGTVLADDHWVWMSTGRPILFTNWIKNQPDNFGNNEKCLEARYSYESLMWNDAVCTAARYAICETTTPKRVSKMTSNSSMTTIIVTPQ
ncbi:C-type lectin mosGCTL-1-like [Leptinotarsa decemlineata]|uniref:C-type lectin mosGCTL-1-like n=1 Tax=Leptinotarsa decemlineata TaxID=7539 RepID=UPI003D3077DD